MDTIFYDNISADALEQLKEDVHILIITATEIEKKILLSHMTPYPPYDNIIGIYHKSSSYYIGLLGAYPIVHVQTNMGSVSPDSAPYTILDALNFWSIKAIIMTGIAFGARKDKDRIGDVLISDSIIQYESQKVKNGEIINRGVIPRSGLTLLNRFKSCETWIYFLNENVKARKIFGAILSGDKLIDDAEFKQALLSRFPEAIGGEMEGAGLYSASFHESVNEWIVVKGICDWGENKSENKEENQKIAAQSAILLCKEVLSSTHVLNALDIESYDEIKKKIN